MISIILVLVIVVVFSASCLSYLLNPLQLQEFAARSSKETRSDLAKDFLQLPVNSYGPV